MYLTSIYVDVPVNSQSLHCAAWGDRKLMTSNANCWHEFNFAGKFHEGAIIRLIGRATSLCKNINSMHMGVKPEHLGHDLVSYTYDECPKCMQFGPKVGQGT